MLKKMVLISALWMVSSSVLYAQMTSSVASATTTAASTKSSNAASTGENQAQNTSAPNATVSVPSRARSSFYTGVGLSMLNNRGYTGLMPKGFVGYGTILGRSKSLYGGVEIFVGIESLTLSPNQTYHITGLAGASVLPGYKISDWTLLFTRLGVEFARYARFNTTKLGGLFGLGFESYLSQHWDLRGEYDYDTNKNLNQYNLDLVYKFC